MTLSVRSSKPRKCQNPACGAEVHPAAPGSACVLSCLRPGHQGQARQAGAEGHR